MYVIHFPDSDQYLTHDSLRDTKDKAYSFARLDAAIHAATLYSLDYSGTVRVLDNTGSVLFEAATGTMDNRTNDLFKIQGIGQGWFPF